MNAQRLKEVSQWGVASPVLRKLDSAMLHSIAPSTQVTAQRQLSLWLADLLSTEDEDPPRPSLLDARLNAACMKVC